MARLLIRHIVWELISLPFAYIATTYFLSFDLGPVLGYAPLVHSLVLMGDLIWHELSRFISISASIYAVWASFWGILFRKFFWDFVGGILRNPGGIQPSPRARVFIAVIVKAPVIQVVTMVLGFTIVALEYPLPPLKRSPIYRSIPLRIVLLILQSFLTVLFYQGTNASLWSLVATAFYVRAITLGERIEVTRHCANTV